MRVREAERFERALQQAERGQEIEPQFQPLVQIAWQAAALAEPSPPPPYGLSPGRQQFLAEAGLMRTARGTAVLKVATALMTIVLLVSLALGSERVVADSLPGEFLYEVKLAAAEIRLDLTTDPQARASLTLVLAEERLDEIAELMRQGRSADDPTLAVVEQHLATALLAAVGMEDSTAVRALQHVEASIQLRQQTMADAISGAPQAEQMRVQQTLQVMERLRQEAHTGQADPDGLRQRLRNGVPGTPTSQPQPGDAPQPGPSPKPRGGGPTDRPKAGPGPKPSPTCQADGPQPTEPEGNGSGPGPRPTDRPKPSGQGPGPQPTDRPEPAEPSGQGPGPRPTDKPAGPRPTDCPDPISQPGDGPGPQPSKEPGQSEPAQQPEPSLQPTEEPGDPGPDPQPPEEPGQPEPPGGSGPGPGPQPPGGNGGGGNGKP